MNTVKTITLFFICLFAVAGGAYAQNSQSTVQLSFAVQPTVNWMNSDKKGVDMTNVKPGFDFGLISDFYFDQRQRYAISSGLLFNITGGEMEYGNDDAAQLVEIGGELIQPGSSVRFNLQYLEIPLAVKLRTAQFRRISYWGQFGLSTAVNIMAKANSSDGVLDRTNIMNDIKTANISLNIGIGFEYDLGWGNALAIGLGFKNGFSDLTKKDVYDGKVNLTSLALRAGLIF